MRRITLPITLQVQGPILTKSSSIGALGLDAVMAKRDFEDAATGVAKSRYYIPGALVKGLLRESWQELATVDQTLLKRALEWLGDASPMNSQDEPARGRLMFDDFADLQNEPKPEQPVRYRIEIDEERGAADAGKLQMMESPYASGQVVDFQGQVRFLVGDEENEEQIDALRSALARGLMWIEAVGGIRTSGFGQLLDVKVGEGTAVTLDSKPSLSGSEWDLHLHFRDPVIFSKRRIADNFFESGEVIPGGALKGAVAEMMARGGLFRELRDQLHLIRFSHAFPAKTGSARPRSWPLSLLFVADEPADVVRRREPEAGKAANVPKAGSFDIDWKDKHRKKVREAYGWPDLKWELRVRTAIDSTLRKAGDQQLFAWQTVQPYGLEWIARVDASRVSEPAREQLEGLLRFGLEPIGKTKALATTILTAADPQTVRAAPRYVVTLQTPGLLIDPGRRLAPNGALGSSKEEDLEREFQDVWKEISDGSLRPVNYFQRCVLAGGEYFQNRFLGRSRGRRPYQYKPYLLSVEGSTFLLEPVDGKEREACACLTEWMQTGLPLSESVRKFYGIPDDPATQWKHCPYVPENGYGEIAVNEPSPYKEL
jgi:hypothetical protein